MPNDLPRSSRPTSTIFSAEHHRSLRSNITPHFVLMLSQASTQSRAEPRPNIGRCRPSINIGQIFCRTQNFDWPLTLCWELSEFIPYKEKLNTPRISSFKQLERVRSKSVIIKLAEEAPGLLSTCFESFGDIYQLCREENNSGSIWVIILSDGWKCYNRGGACRFAKEAPCARWACCSCYEGHWVILSYCLRFLLLLLCWSKWNF